jgi:hypothetical protein
VSTTERYPTVAARARTKTTAVAWLAHARLTLDEWQGYGSRLGTVSKSTNWWLGDWVRFGQRQYDQRYREAAQVTGYDEQTLMNFAYVAGRYDVSRRRERLSWSHHAELAALDPATQDLWLDHAMLRGLSIRQLRAAVRHAQRPANSGLETTIQAFGDELSAAGQPVVCPHCGGVITVDENSDK